MKKTKAGDTARYTNQSLSRRDFLTTMAVPALAGVKPLSADASTQSTMKTFLCAWPEKEIRSRGCQGVRIDVQGFGRSAGSYTPYEVSAIAETARAMDLTPLVLVRDANQITELPYGAWVEIRNEPDIGTNQQLSPQQYAGILNSCIDARNKRSAQLNYDIPIFMGAISNLNARGFNFLKELFQIHAWPSYVGVSVHRYPAGSFCQPHDGFASRYDEMMRLFDIIGDREWGISEVGYHTAPDHGLRLTNEEVFKCMRAEFDFFARYGATFCTAYQINDGPDDTPINRFGFRYLQRDAAGGSIWKPVASIFDRAYPRATTKYMPRTYLDTCFPS